MSYIDHTIKINRDPWDNFLAEDVLIPATRILAIDALCLVAAITLTIVWIL